MASLDALKDATLRTFGCGLAEPDLGPAIRALGELTRQACPFQKLNCLILFRRLLTTGPSSHLLTADDLVSLFALALVRTRPPYLLTEIQILSDWLDRDLLVGEGGYCVTTLQVAVSAIQAVSP